jgi:hypothetical protein
VLAAGALGGQLDWQAVERAEKQHRIQPIHLAVQTAARGLVGGGLGANRLPGKRRQAGSCCFMTAVESRGNSKKRHTGSC